MFKRHVVQLLTISVVAVGAAWAVADDKDKPRSPETRQTAAQAAFEKIKQLAGTWVSSDDKDSEMKKAQFVYRVTAGGSAVMETIMPGTEHEMITMYHLDGEKLVMTHYCMLGNQPHMESHGLTGNKIEFVCDGHGGNMKSENDMHMHSATFTFIDDDHFKSEWVSYKDGKPGGHTGTFDLRRKK